MKTIYNNIIRFGGGNLKYQATINIVDLETGEIKDLNLFSEGLADMTFEESVERVVILKDLVTEICGMYRVNEFKFIQMMNEREAKKYVNDEIEIRLLSQTDYEYDVNCVNQIKNLISQDDFEKIFTQQYKVNRNLLRTIYTLGGDVKKLIDQMETKNQRKPTVNIKPK